MLELLEETSRLSAASLLRPPTSTEPEDPVLAWRQAVQTLVQPEQPHLFKAVAFSRLQVDTNACFPTREVAGPVLHHFQDVVWIRGGGALYDGESGLAIPGSFLTRMPRQRQTPTCSLHRLELTRPLRALPRLERAFVLPFALCNNFGHFMTETLAFLWPLFPAWASSPDSALDLTGWPVLLSACPPGDPASRVLHALLRERHAFPLLEADLPDQLHLEDVQLPQPSLRLHDFCSETYLCTAAAVGDWLLKYQNAAAGPSPGGEKLFISRSALGPEARSVDQEAALEVLLQELGWSVFRPEQHTLAQQVAVYRNARVVAAFEGSALHGLSFLGLVSQPPVVVMLGDSPSPDYFLQFRAQRIPGFFIQCTRSDPESERPPWTQPRLLNGSAQALAAMIDALARNP
jgi:hypothetical protein